MTQSLHRLHASTPVIMLVLSVFSGKGNMLSTPLASVSLSALSPLPYCSWPRGTVGFLNALSPFVSTHWLALCSSKSRAAWGASRSSTSSSSTSRSCRCPPEKGKEKQSEEKNRKLQSNLSRYVCLCSSNENQLGLSESISESSVLLLATLQFSLRCRLHTTHNNTTDL